MFRWLRTSLQVYRLVIWNPQREPCYGTLFGFLSLTGFYSLVIFAVLTVGAYAGRDSRIGVFTPEATLTETLAIPCDEMGLSVKRHCG